MDFTFNRKSSKSGGVGIYRREQSHSRSRILPPPHYHYQPCHTAPQLSIQAPGSTRTNQSESKEVTEGCRQSSSWVSSLLWLPLLIPASHLTAGAWHLRPPWATRACTRDYSGISGMNSC